MARGLAFTVGLTVLIALVLVHPTCCATNATAMVNHTCSASSCGNIHNISFPFRLKTDPENCGDSRYVLSCDENNRTVLYLFGGKYYVQEISYNNYTIRIVDSGIHKDNYFSFSTPTYSLSRYNFSSEYPVILPTYTTCLPTTPLLRDYGRQLSRSLALMSCEKPVHSPLYLDTSTCNYNDNFSSTSDSKRYRYVKVGETYASEMKVWCQVEKMFLTSWPTNNDDQNISCTDVHNQLVYGFEISWLIGTCTSYCGRFNNYCYLNDTNHLQCDNYCYLNDTNHLPCDNYCHLQCDNYCYLNDTNHLQCGNYCYLNDTNHLQCDNFNTFSDDTEGLLIRIRDTLLGWLPGFIYQSQYWWNALVKNGEYTEYRLFRVYTVLYTVLLHLATKIVLGIPCVVAFLIYKWRRRHLSMYDAVEEFLQSQINLMPIRYSYSEIRTMSKGFKDKLGEGGYGTVYKGKLESGPFVAIKMLGSSKANGQEFINEVATIGRIHHMNVVQLIGFCAEGPKRALIYEFMPNGSLEKYIFSREESIPLSIEKTYEISLGVARGIGYLHRGCDVQILHFDIKPHNILLDENFIPKVSDFGLAKLYPTNDSIVSLTAARGTLGYIAPELFYKNIGGVSYKADVYSFGMLLLEMANRRKNVNAFANHSSQIYFPTWVYGQFSEGNDIEMEDATEEEKKIAKKMIMVALWCIQMKPSDRPSMNKVVEMLEGEVEYLQMPSKPFLSSSPGRLMGDVEDNLNSTSSSFQSGESSQLAKL